MRRRGYLKTTLGAFAGRAAMGLARGDSFAPVAPLVYEAGKKFPLESRGAVPPDEVRVLAGYLSNWFLPEGAMPEQGGWRAVFDLLDYSATRTGSEGPVMTNSLLGQVAIQRVLGASEYRIQQHFRPCFAAEELSASVDCNEDEVRSIRGYELLWKSSGPQPYERREAGRLEEGGLCISDGSPKERQVCHHRLTTLWTLMDAVRFLPASGDWGRRFDLHMDLSSLRRNQRIRFRRFGEVPTAKGPVPVRFYEQTGEGIQPIHYAVDEENRTLLVTQGLLGWGLNRIERA